MGVRETKLAWTRQAHLHPFTGQPLDAAYPKAALHFAASPVGTFEIFEDGQNFLLSFPRGMRLPAELFHDIDAAQSHALSALQDQRHEQ